MIPCITGVIHGCFMGMYNKALYSRILYCTMHEDNSIELVK